MRAGILLSIIIILLPLTPHAEEIHGAAKSGDVAAITAALDAGADTIPFADGRWHGNIETGLNNSGFEACSASTTFVYGSAFTLTMRKDGIWYLQLSNPAWQLPHPHRYDMTALVDFYPRLHLSGEAKTSTILEIADLEHISLLAFIENGHTIDLASDGFNEKFELEGSAKVIERIRNCFAEQSAAGKPAMFSGKGK